MALKPQGSLTIRRQEDTLQLRADGVDRWALDLSWSDGKTVPIPSVEQHAVRYNHNGFAYTLQLANGTSFRLEDEPRIRITPTSGMLGLRFNP